VASPIPEVPPVMRATLFCKRMTNPWKFFDASSA
jgi:hypothetical protein